MTTQQTNWIDSESICVCCGERVSEGRMICARCENEEDWKERIPREGVSQKPQNRRWWQFWKR